MNDTTPDCCKDLHDKVDRILDLLQARRKSVPCGVFVEAPESPVYWSNGQRVRVGETCGRARPCLVHGQRPVVPAPAASAASPRPKPQQMS